MKELYKVLEDNYEILDIKKIVKTNNGSGKSYFVETSKDKYVLKVNEREDFVMIYDKVQTYLNVNNLKQSKIIKTKDDKLITPNGEVLYEFIDGLNLKSLSEEDNKKVIKYIKKYNEYLSQINVNKEDLKLRNSWDLAGDLDFIVNQFPEILNNINIEMSNKEIINKAIIIIKDNFEILKKNQQLIHADLGLDNFIFDSKKEVLAIIDFTPHFHHEIYSISHYIYWNYLWKNVTLTNEVLKNILYIYYSQEVTYLEIRLLKLLNLQSCLFRVVGPILNIYNNKQDDYSSLDKRIALLDRVLKI